MGVRRIKNPILDVLCTLGMSFLGTETLCLSNRPCWIGLVPVLGSRVKYASATKWSDNASDDGLGEDVMMRWGPFKTTQPNQLININDQHYFQSINIKTVLMPTTLI